MTFGAFLEYLKLYFQDVLLQDMGDFALLVLEIEEFEFHLEYQLLSLYLKKKRGIPS